MTNATKQLGPWMLGGLVLASCAKNGYSIDTAPGADAGAESGLVTVTARNDGNNPPADASADAIADVPLCDLSAPFGAPTALEIGVRGRYVAATLNADETLIVMSGLGHDDAGAVTADHDLYIATRAGRMDAFGVPTVIAAVSTSHSEEFPSLSPDGLTLYFTRYVVLDSGAEVRTNYFAHRSSLAASFTAPLPAGVIANHSVFGAFAERAGRYYLGYFDDTPTDNTYDIALYDPSSDAGVVLGSSTFASINTPYWDYDPVVTADGLTMYFTSNRSSTTTTYDEAFSDIYISTRASIGDAFRAATRVAELSTPLFQRTDWVSPDGCRLYMTSETVADPNLVQLVAEKPPATK